MTLFWLRWAVLDGKRGVHADTPTVSECEAEGYYAIGGTFPNEGCNESKR